MYKGKIKHIHFVGIGGIGMSGIAEVLINLGYRVTGSDMKISEATKRLERLGAVIHISHRGKNINGADVVVYSSAVKEDNPEIEAAHEMTVPVIPRAEMLAELMRMKYGIAIAGTHGKTTTTSIIATILGSSGMDPTVVIGGRLNSIGTNARLGKGEFLVAEADESDGTFLKLSPTIAVVTNIDPEHMDYYKDMDEVKNAYLSFINKVPFYGCCVLCLDHPNVQALISRVERKHITYGLTAQADCHARGIEFKGMETSFEVWNRHESLGRVTIRIPGIHNIYNSLAAIAVAIELGLNFEDVKNALAGFSGVERRFQIKGIVNNITVVDDYGHHPAEIRATLKAAKDGWGKRIVALFQPHRYTRTKDLYEDFLSAFYDADVLILTDIYPAGEEKIEGVSSEALFHGIKGYGHRDVTYIPDKKDVPAHLAKIVRSGDMVIIMGAGDIWQTGEEILKQMGQKAGVMGQLLNSFKL
ncbi:MAG: UDP-N-acetylmuramate--L-alanine ligase [Deltaproteobacteria bacterium GWC2_42_11]|nr:MAG: UDP-N-acetylmuramate--L-alanine ligase [Deltaproteobacteria bacterium GWC2_42_11]HBO83684.1 UDP-N-acetylmuramate--L-alanine ligase [Deltaproteobacteria bacterium]